MDKKDKNSFEIYEKKIEKEFENSTIFNSEDSSEKTTVVKKKKIKSPYVRLLSGLLCVAILISASVVAINYLWPVKQEDVTSDNSDDSNLISLTASANVELDKMKNAKKGAISNILKIEIKNETDKFLVKPYTDYETDEDGKKQETVSYKIVGADKDIPINNSLVSEFADNIFNVDAINKLDSKWSEKDCGLVTPKIKVSVTLADNSKFTIALGNKVPNGNEYYYGQTSLKDGIYVVDGTVYDNFSKTLKDLVDTQVFNALTSSGDKDTYFTQGSLTKYDSISISGQNYPDQVDLGYVKSDEIALIYQILNPVRTYASDEKISDILSPLKEGLLASSIYEIKPNSKMLKEYGLDKPYLELKYKVKNENYIFKFSKVGIKDNNFVACMVDDVPIIYSVPMESVSFLNWSLDSIRYSQLYVRNIDSVSSVTAEYGGKSYKYGLTFDKVVETTASGTDTTTETTASSEAETELNVVLNASPINSTYFKYVYQRIIKTSATKYLDIGEKGPSKSPYLKLTIGHKNGKDKEIITYTKYNENYYLFRLNGIGDELIPTRKVELLVDNFEKLRKGEEVISPNNQQ